MSFFEKQYSKLLFDKNINIARNAHKTKLLRNNIAKRTNLKKSFRKKNQEIRIF